jgi:hypothetical protein
MRETIGERNRAAWTVRLGQLVISGIGVDLQHPMKPVEMFLHVLPSPILRVAVDHHRRGRSLPRTVIDDITPQPSDSCPSARAVQDRQRRVVAEHLGRRHHRRDQQRIQRLQPPRRPFDPAHEGGAVEIDAVPGQHLRLAVQRQMPGELRGGDMGEQRGRRQAAFNRTRRGRRLHHGALAGAAAVARAMDPLHPDDRRHDVEHFADVLADPMQCALAARACACLGFNDDVLTRQMFGQTADVARRFAARRPCPGLPRRLLGLGFARRRRHIVERQQQLRRVAGEPFRTGAKQRPLQRLHDSPQLIILVAQIGDHPDQNVGVARQ